MTPPLHTPNNHNCRDGYHKKCKHSPINGNAYPGWNYVVAFRLGYNHSSGYQPNDTKYDNQAEEVVYENCIARLESDEIAKKLGHLLEEEKKIFF